MSRASAPLSALAGIDAASWLVGGAVRDRLLGREVTDLDVVVKGDPAAVARQLGRTAGGHAFELSEMFGSWRVVAYDRRWQLDVMAVAGEEIEDDLARRDLTINAIAEPVGGAGEATCVDPFGGIEDLRTGTLRMVSASAFADDPLRALRVVRLAAELGFEIEPGTAAAARRQAAELDRVAPERTFAELKRLICSERAVLGIELIMRLGISAAVLPELDALDGVQQSRFHHLDVLEHTRQVLAETVALVDDPGSLCRSDADQETLRRWLDRPLANELSRGQALRFGALLHDIAKPQTRDVTPEGRVTFMGHDAAGSEQAAAILRRLRASDRLCAHVGALALNHLRLGFLVHRMPLDRRRIYDYLHTCAPVGVDVTLLSVADRLATRGDNAEAAIAKHVELARQLLVEALAWEASPPRPPVRGDELARALGIRPGPQIGDLLAELEAAAFSGELVTTEEAIDRARRLISSGSDR